MAVFSGKMEPNGRVTVPLSMRRALGLEAGGNVVLELSNGEIRVRTIESVMDEARALTKKMLGENHTASVADFLADRRREAADDL